MTNSKSLAERLRLQLGTYAEAEPILRDWLMPTELRPQVPHRLPVCRWLSDTVALAGPSCVQTVALLAEVADDLEWRQTYSAQDFGAAFLEHYGWTELIGLRGPIPSETAAAGFLLLGPEVEYPSHSHAAAELYLPLAGTALWKRGAGDYEAVQPGKIIQHESWEHMPWRPAKSRSWLPTCGGAATSRPSPGSMDRA